MSVHLGASKIASAASSVHPVLASTPSLSLFFRPHPLYPSSATTHSRSLYNIHPTSSYTSITCLYTQPHPLHPSSATTSSLSLYNHPQQLHPASVTILSTAALMSSPVLPQPLHPASTSTFIFGLCIHPQPLHPASHKPHIYMMLKIVIFLLVLCNNLMSSLLSILI